MNRENYDSIAAQWDASRASLLRVEERLLGRWLHGVSRGARILDLGCGTGRPIAEHLDRLGFAVTGVDQSTGMLAIARARLPQCDWIECPLERFQSQDTFCAAIAWDSLFHIERAEHAAIFERVRAALQEHGRFLLTVGGSEHPAFTDTMFGREFFYDSHAPDTCLSVLRSAGFHVEHSQFLEKPTSGRDKGRFAIVARAK